MRFLLLSLLLSTAALAQADLLFGSGKPPVFKEEELDRRFLKSKVNRALTQGTADPRCAQLLGGLLTVLGEVAPMLHKRDENFYLDPALVQALNTQLTTPRFPGNAYLAAMVRRVLIDRQMPRAWLENAPAFNPRLTVDMGKLRYLADGIQPVDSFLFTLPVLKDRYEQEVIRATSAVADTAETAFRDTYLDRDVAWGGLALVDAGAERRALPRKGRGKLKAPEPAAEPAGLVAHLEWRPVSVEPVNPLLRNVPGYVKKPPPPIRITARLAEQQYIDLAKVPRGTRVTVRGRLWNLAKAGNELELRDALLFEDRDWSQSALVDPSAVAGCPFATNELNGLAPRQPGGFAH
jgi:hypothetical protein